MGVVVVVVVVVDDVLLLRQAVLMSVFPSVACHLPLDEALPIVSFLPLLFPLCYDLGVFTGLR